MKRFHNRGVATPAKRTVDLYSVNHISCRHRDNSVILANRVGPKSDLLTPTRNCIVLSSLILSAMQTDAKLPQRNAELNRLLPLCILGGGLRLTHSKVRRPISELSCGLGAKTNLGGLQSDGGCQTLPLLRVQVLLDSELLLELHDLLLREEHSPLPSAARSVEGQATVAQGQIPHVHVGEPRCY